VFDSADIYQAHNFGVEEIHEELKLDPSGMGIEKLGCEMHHRLMP
jgi:hypothetical protein